MNACHLLLNRGAGGPDRGLDVQELRFLVEYAFGETGRKLETRLLDPEEIEPALRQLAQTSPDLIILGGGDGTVSTAASCLGGTGITLGVLPMGTFNLAARDLGVPLDLEKAATFLAQASAHDIDVMEVNDRGCLCTMILGFYPEFSDSMERDEISGHWWKKVLKVLQGLPAQFSRSRMLDLHWKTGEQSGHARTKFAAFVPGRYREAPGVIPSRDGLQRGILTGYIDTQHSGAKAMRAAWKFATGHHESHEGLIMLESTSAELSIPHRRRCKVMLDGEILHLRLPIRMKIRPQHLRVLTDPSLLHRV